MMSWTYGPDFRPKESWWHHLCQSHLPIENAGIGTEAWPGKSADPSQTAWGRAWQNFLCGFHMIPGAVDNNQATFWSLNWQRGWFGADIHKKYCPWRPPNMSLRLPRQWLMWFRLSIQLLSQAHSLKQRVGSTGSLEDANFKAKSLNLDHNSQGKNNDNTQTNIFHWKSLEETLQQQEQGHGQGGCWHRAGGLDTPGVSWGHVLDMCCHSWCHNWCLHPFITFSVSETDVLCQ